MQGMRLSRHVTLLALAAAALGASVTPVTGYSPGSGSIYSEDFELALDPDWVQGSGASPWERKKLQGDWKLNADGQGTLPGSPTRHWAYHHVQPVPAETYSIAFEFRADLAAGYRFDVEIEQRAPLSRRYRLRVDEQGAVSIWRTEGGSFVQLASTAVSVVPDKTYRWIRLAVEPDPSGHRWLRARVWSGGATSEPTGWDLEYLDTAGTLERVHRFHFDADGAAGENTWIDDIDVFGDGSIGVASSIQTIYMLEMSHLDIGFTEPPDDVALFGKTHLDSVLSNLAADPAYRWTIESSWWLDRWWEQSSPAEHQQMLDALNEGRLKLAAGYASLTTGVTGHEELSRNIYWSSRFAREHDIPLRVFLHDDVPGNGFELPEILAKAGIDYYVGGHNTTFGGRLTAPSHGDRPFWWKGPDGSRVLSWFTYDNYAEGFDYGFSFFDNLTNMYANLGKNLPAQEEAGYAYPQFLMMRGFDNHYQNFHVRNLVNQWNSTYSNPQFVLSTAEEFLDMMLATYGAAAFPEFSGDSRGAWARSKANAPHTRERVRRAHRNMRAAEALHAAGAAIDGDPYPRTDTDFAYRKMLEVDEHSGAGGWPGYFTPEEMTRNNEQHLGFADDALSTSETLLSSGLDRALAQLSAVGDAIVAVNPLGRSRSGWVRHQLSQQIFDSTFRLIDRATGTERPYQKFPATREVLFWAEDVPSVGYLVHDIVAGTPSPPATGLLSATTTTLENDFYAVQIDPADGSLTSVFDKVNARELVDSSSSFRFNRLGSNTKAQYDAGQDPVEEAVSGATVTVVTSGPLVAEVEVTRTGTPHVETTYRLYRGENRLEIENVLDKDQMPYVAQATGVIAYYVTLPFDVHDFEVRTETSSRFLDPTSDGFGRDTVFPWHNTEHSLALWDTAGGVILASNEIATHHVERIRSIGLPASFDTADALLLPRLNDEADEYEFDDGTIGSFVIEPGTSSLLRATHHLRGTAASFDPIETSRFGFEALSPLLSKSLVRRTGNLPDDSASFVTVDDPNVLLYTVKGPEIGDGLTVRLVDLGGAATTAYLSSDALLLSAADAVEHDEEGGSPLPMIGDDVQLALDPYETATVRIDASAGWEPVDLTVTKDAPSGEVRLEWIGGRAPYTVRRAEDALFQVAPTTLADEEPVSLWADPVLFDGTVYFYVIR